MSLAFYLDHHVPVAIAVGLRQRQIDVLTAQEDGRADWEADRLMKRTFELGRVVFTQDRDFLVLAADWQRQHREFAGMVYGHQLRITIGGAVYDLALIATLLSLDDMRNRVEFLPL